eukprot:TRINITY_DN3495_c0_g1_i1.p1 TRINITY_DN3495_c0_g1~~TRINITY_DN3495_c0_g1_i1.p1  ORF type:complete len:791 (+),score=239.08 TRINITY_DN3495_c0_g1_i1:43-2373(+)
MPVPATALNKAVRPPVYVQLDAHSSRIEELRQDLHRRYSGDTRQVSGTEPPPPQVFAPEALAEAAAIGAVERIDTQLQRLVSVLEIVNARVDFAGRATHDGDAQAALAARIDMLEADVRRLSVSAAAAQDSAAASAEQIASLRTRADAADSGQERQRCKLRRVEQGLERVDGLVGEVQCLRIGAAEAEDRIQARAAATADELRQAIAAVASQVSAVETRAGAVESQSSEAAAAASRDLDGVRSAVADLESGISAVQSRVGNTDQRVDALASAQHHLVQVHSELASLRSADQKQAADIQQQLRQGLAGISAGAAETSSALADLRSRVDAAAADRAALRAQVDEAAVAAAAMRSRIDETAADAAAMRSRIDEAEAETAAVRSRIDEAAAETAAQIDETAAEVAAVRADGERLRSSVERLASDVVDWRESSAAEHAGLKLRCGSLEAEAAVQSRVLASVTARVDGVAAGLSAVRAAVARAGTGWRHLAASLVARWASSSVRRRSWCILTDLRGRRAEAVRRRAERLRRAEELLQRTQRRARLVYWCRLLRRRDSRKRQRLALASIAAAALPQLLRRCYGKLRRAARRRRRGRYCAALLLRTSNRSLSLRYQRWCAFAARRRRQRRAASRLAAATRRRMLSRAWGLLRRGARAAAEDRDLQRLLEPARALSSRVDNLTDRIDRADWVSRCEMTDMLVRLGPPPPPTITAAVLADARRYSEALRPHVSPPRSAVARIEPRVIPPPRAVPSPCAGPSPRAVPSPPSEAATPPAGRSPTTFRC